MPSIGKSNKSKSNKNDAGSSSAGLTFSTQAIGNQILEEMVDGLAAMPIHVVKDCALMRELDQKVLSIVEETRHQIFNGDLRYLKETNYVAKQFEEANLLSEEKIQLTIKCYEEVDRYISKLDKELARLSDATNQERFAHTRLILEEQERQLNLHAIASQAEIHPDQIVAAAAHEHDEEEYDEDLLASQPATTTATAASSSNEQNNSNNSSNELDESTTAADEVSADPSTADAQQQQLQQQQQQKSTNKRKAVITGSGRKGTALVEEQLQHEPSAIQSNLKGAGSSTAGKIPKPSIPATVNKTVADAVKRIHHEHGNVEMAKNGGSMLKLDLKKKKNETREKRQRGRSSVGDDLANNSIGSSAVASSESGAAQKLSHSRKRTKLPNPATTAASDSQDLPVDPQEPVYCYCRKISYGQMVACDNADCPTEWFHFACVGLTEAPHGPWKCKDCKERELAKQTAQKSKKKSKRQD